MDLEDGSVGKVLVTQARHEELSSDAPDAWKPEGLAFVSNASVPMGNGKQTQEILQGLAGQLTWLAAVKKRQTLAQTRRELKVSS